jgi:hypothetical protein
MLLFWLIFVCFAIAETCVVFWVPFGADSPPIWSQQNIKHRKRFVLIHSLILAAYLGVVGLLTWQERSFNWLSSGISLQRVFGFIFTAVLTGVIERQLFFRIPAPRRTKATEELD